MTDFFLSHWIAFLNLALLLCASAFFSGSETAFFSLNSHQKHDLSLEDCSTSKLILELINKPTSLLVSILLGNLIVNVMFFSISAMLTAKLASGWQQAVFGLAVLFTVIIFGEIVPKAVGVAKPLVLARSSAGVLWFWGRVSSPVRKILEAITCLLEPRNVQKHSTVNEEELLMLMNLSQQSGRIKPETGEMIEDVIELSSMKVKHVMIPRVDLFQCPNTMSVDEYIQLALKHKLSFVPVYEGSVDNLIGVVNTRRVCLDPGTYTVLRDFTEEVRYVPETKLTGELLDEMIKQNENLVMVVDEYGGISGMATQKDLLEEIMGNLDVDREAEDEIEVINVDKSTFKVPGHLPIVQWKEFFEAPLDESSELVLRASTLSGLIIALLGHFPKVGEQVSYCNLLFTVNAIQNRRVTEVLVRVKTS